MIAAAIVSAQAQFSDAVRAYIKVDAAVVALTNVRVIDGTGAPPRPHQTIIISNGTIDRIGDSASASPPPRDPRPFRSRRHAPPRGS